jgi:GEVED domain/Domain of unknown function DUF11/Secretion system C-terminal sorting domain/CARDB
VWIDYNQNKVFETTELVASFTRNTTTANVVVPTTALTGATRMRVSLKTIGAPTACEVFDKGEVEDYTVNIQGSVNNSCRTQDSLQLVSLYNATNGANWITKWNLATPIDTWFGVILDANGCVSSIQINNNYLNGSLPNLNLPNLKTLELPGNPLTTNLPNLSLPNLERLDLSVCKFTGAIPNFNLPKLKYLILYSNKFTGTIPNFNYPNLQTISLANNQLTGAIPNFNLPQLIILALNDNQLSGAIPNLNAPSINSFVVYNNQLNGCIPAFLKGLCNPYASVDFSGNPNLSTQNFTAYCTNNTGACATPLPDFRITDIKEGSAPVDLTNTTYRAGLDGFPVLVTVVNDGAATADILTTSVFLSADTVLDSRDSILGVPLQSSGVGNFIIGGRVPYYADGDYYIIGKTNSNNAIRESNANNNTLVLKTPKVKIRSNNLVDAAISINSSLGAYTPFSQISYRITAYNRGTKVLTNVKVEFKFPAKTVAGGTATPSVGTWQEWCSGGVQCFTWTIPSLAVDALADLDVPIFILNATGPLVATAKLLSSTPTDGTPLNNSATRTINPNTAPLAPVTQALAFQVPTQLIPVVIQRISPNPTEGDVEIKLDSWTKQEVDFNFSDITGKTIHSEKRPLEKGMNRVAFDVYHLPQGVYFIQTNVGKGRNVPTKFVKM